MIDRDNRRRYTTDDGNAAHATAPQRSYGYVARLPCPSANHLVIIAGTDGRSLLSTAEAIVAPVPPDGVSRRTASPSGAFKAVYRIDSAGDVQLGRRRMMERPLDPTGMWDTSDVSQQFPDDIPFR